jgi:hypothetical protein
MLDTARHEDGADVDEAQCGQVTAIKVTDQAAEKIVIPKHKVDTLDQPDRDQDVRN